MKANIDQQGFKEGTKFKVPETVTLSKPAKSLGKMDTRATLGLTLNEGEAEELNS